MNEKEKQFLKYWEKKREAGMFKFSLVTGFTYAIFVLVFAKLFAWDFHFSSSDILISIVAILIGILILGPFLWWNRERKYHKLLSKNNSGKKKRFRKK